MKILGSLTNRIFLASAALAMVSIGSAVLFVSRATTQQAETELERGLIEAGMLVDQQTASLVQNFTVTAKLVADLPKLKAAVADADRPTAQPIADDYREQMGAGVLNITDTKGRLLASAGGVAPDTTMEMVTVPIAVGLEHPELLGTLTLGLPLDQPLAERFKQVTESEIAFAEKGRITASTLPRGTWSRLEPLLGSRSVQPVAIGDNDYVALAQPLTPLSAQQTVLVLRSRTERLRFLNRIHTGLAIMAVVAVVLATFLSYAVARTITRPLAAITGAMREMSATGDLTRKIAIGGASRLQDEDARLLAATFNSLTDSIARFQREAGQRERLSSLGRLSTVVAHEIRNPLMIIKGSLRVLASDQTTAAERRQALVDVDEEVARLNRVVNDVLDFARPIRFDYAPADINAVCADAEHATRGTAGDIAIDVHGDPMLTNVTTDAERLRTALVNIFTNARHAVADRRAAARPAEGGGADIQVQTMKTASGGASIVIRDRGTGIKPEDMPRVFDPYFTTKRTGSGLGLAIAKNIVEGMGGAIAVRSKPDEGTEIRIELPEIVAPAAGAPS